MVTLLKATELNRTGTDFLHYFNLLVDIRNKQLIDQVTGLKRCGHTASANFESISVVNPEHPFRHVLKYFPNITSFNPTISKHNITHFIETNGPPISSKPRRLTAEKLVIANVGPGDLPTFKESLDSYPIPHFFIIYFMVKQFFQPLI